MEEDIDPFLEDDDVKGVGTEGVNCEPSDDHSELGQNSLKTSPILNGSGFGQKFSNSMSRKSRLRRSRSGAFPGPCIPLPVAHTLINLKIPPSSPSDDFLLSQELQSDFIAPKTPARKVPQRNFPQQCTSDSDEDIFATSMCGEQALEEEPIVPSALNALLDGPEPADLSWTSSMATPLASNVTWSNLNTEERKVLLPSDDCNVAVKPRALFLPDMNDAADCNLLNTSSDAECMQTLRGEMTDKTPKFRGRKNSLMSKTPVESPLATALVADNGAFGTPNHKFDQNCDSASRGSPILSGSNEFTKTPKREEEDLFDNDEEYLSSVLPGLQTSGAEHSKIAESTPNIGSRQKSPAECRTMLLTPLQNRPSQVESFLEDISITALEEACQAEELKEASLPPVSTPEKQPDTKRKRLLFSTNSGASNPTKFEFKIPESKPVEKEVDFLQENLSDHCIPDDSFMEHLAAMNTSIFSDTPPQPVTKVQSIKSSLSTMKNFCYSIDQKSDQNSLKTSSTSEPQALIKEILSSVIELESSAKKSVKTKLVKSSGDLVTFSQLEQEISKELDQKEGKVELVECSDIYHEPKPVLNVDKSSSTFAGFAELQEWSTSSAPPVITEGKQSESNSFNDDLAAEEVKQLLQLVNDGEDFHPWHEMEQPLSTKSKKASLSPEHPEAKLVTTMGSEKSTSISTGTEKVNMDSISCGFSTASGKNISVSDEKLAQAKQLLLEAADDCADLSGKESRLDKNGLHEEICSSVHLSGKNENCNIKNTYINKEVSCHVDRKRSFMQAANSSGYTVPKKKACLGNSASTSTPTLQCNQNRNTNTNHKERQEKAGCSTSEIQTSALDDSGMNITEETMNFMNNVLDHFAPKKQRDNVPTSSKSEMPISFSTAGGKTVNVSKQSLNKVKNLFDDLKDESGEKERWRECFKTMPTATSVDNEIAQLEANAASLPKTGPLLFSTASGKSVTVSEQALNRVKNLFDDLPEECVSHFKEKSASESAKMINDNYPTCVGFSTANGSAVDVSEKAISKAKTLFKDISEAELELKESKGSLKTTASNSRRSLGSVSKHRTPSQPKVQPLVPEIERGSFAMASGKRVTVSKQALNKVKGIFDDIPTAIDLDQPHSSDPTVLSRKTPSSKIGGFSTAAGKTVTVSKQALNKVKGIFDDIQTAIDLDQPHSSDPTVSRQKTPSSKMDGFSTAAGKTVTVSKQALKKVKNLFDNLSELDPPQQHTATHGGNAMMSRGQCVSNGEKQLTCDTDLMQGFSTAGGKTVNISREALNKVKGLFDSEDLAIGSLQDSVSTFSKVRCENVSSLGLLKSAATSHQSIEMAGFSTAGGKTVNISKEALSKARNLFDDLPSESSNSLEEGISMNSFNIGKASKVVADDSGVFMSHEPDLKSKESSSNSLLKFPKSPGSHHANKENQIFSSVTNSSLTQEISESTAAILADDDSFGTAESFDGTYNSRQTIITSPSMVTDRLSNLKPILSSLPGNKTQLSEPTSPILMKSNGMRKRPRRGRLSLSTNVTNGTQPTSPLGSQSVCSSQRLRLSLPCDVSALSLPPNATISDEVPEVSKSSSSTDLSQSPSSRRLFVHERVSSPTKLDTPNAKPSLQEPQRIDPEAATARMSDPKDLPNSRRSVQAPLMRRSLTKNHTAQSSGFKTPFKNGKVEPQKRSSSSPAKNPPEAKRMKPSSNLYVSHIYIPSGEPEKLGPRTLRPEVAEMRRRAMEEQRQLVENYAEHKGELLRPCTGSWLSARIRNGESRAKLIQMVEMGTPAIHSSSDLAIIGIKPSTISVTADNSVEFRFSAWDYFSEDMCRENVAGIRVGDGALLVLDSQGSAGVEEFERSFLASPGVDPSLVPSGWIKNHYRWIVWKLAALEWRFPHKLGGRCLSPHVLMQQLKYRFDREIDRCERPALRRILERDDPAAKRMVLCVASILNKEQEGTGLELELTDGWYSLTASIDQDMQHRVKKGVIGVGMKLIMHGAELINCSEGCYPLQVGPEVRLKLCSNSTRRARWHAKLGFQGNPGPINVSLGSILGSGGLVSCISAYVARVYPIAFMEKTEERTVVRSQRAELKEKARCEIKRQQLAEAVYCQVQAELQQEQNKQRRSAVKFSHKSLSNLTSGEELFEILENASDPLSVQSMLSEEQKSIISEYQRMKQDELRSEMEARVRLKLSENPNHERQVTPVLKVRLFECHNGKQSCAILSIWRASEDMSSAFKEGHKLTVFGAVANGLRFGELQLSANRSTRYHPNNALEINSELMRTVSPLSSLILHGSVPRFGELDVVGVVIRISPAPQTPGNTSYFQTVYLSDRQLNIVGISFREGIKAFGVEDLITPHSFIAVSNLQWRGSPVVRAFPCVYASELSFFTTNPRQMYLQSALQELRRSITDLKTFCRVCEEKLDNVLLKVPSPVVSPKTPDSYLPSSKLPEEILESSKLIVQNETPSNVSSLPAVKAQRRLLMDQQSKSPAPIGGHSPAVENRLSKLEMYGEPPPISPILISQSRRSLRRDFKAPRRTDSPLADCKKLDKPSCDQN